MFFKGWVPCPIADFKIVLKFTPLYKAGDVEAEVRLWGWYIPLLMPERDKVSLIHLAIVSFEHCLYGGTVVMKKHLQIFLVETWDIVWYLLQDIDLGLKEMILRSGVVGGNLVDCVSTLS